MSKRFQTLNGPSQRQLRAGEVIRHAIVEILQRGEIHDEKLTDVPVTITEVRPSPDLRTATVFCTVLGGENVEASVKALNAAAPRIRGGLGRKIQMKFTPQLKFRSDDSFDEAQRIDALLAQETVRRDLED